MGYNDWPIILPQIELNTWPFEEIFNFKCVFELLGVYSATFGWSCTNRTIFLGSSKEIGKKGKT